ncbi:MAG: DNA alkylation repair protein [Chloroflexota bacterium]
MPAVDPWRLARQVEAVLASSREPASLTRACLDLFEFYADRARRAVGAVRAAAPTAGFGTPRPVVRALADALRGAFADRPDEALVYAASLWQPDAREPRSLAVALLSGVATEDVAAWAEPRAAATDDFTLLADMAAIGLEKWRSERRQAFMGQVSRWLQSESDRLRALALLSLAAEVEAPSFEDLPQIFRLLAAAPRSRRGPARRALIHLLQLLVRRTPQETARFLLDQLQADPAEGAALIHTLLPAFPARQQEILRQALADQGRLGIIRAVS